MNPSEAVDAGVPAAGHPPIEWRTDIEDLANSCRKLVSDVIAVLPIVYHGALFTIAALTEGRAPLEEKTAARKALGRLAPNETEGKILLAAADSMSLAIHAGSRVRADEEAPLHYSYMAYSEACRLLGAVQCYQGVVPAIDDMVKAATLESDRAQGFAGFQVHRRNANVVAKQKAKSSVKALFETWHRSKKDVVNRAGKPMQNKTSFAIEMLHRYPVLKSINVITDKWIPDWQKELGASRASVKKKTYPAP